MFIPLDCDPDFQRLLEPLDGERTVPEREQPDGLVQGTTYGLWPDLRLAAYNAVWLKFSQENGGEPAISTRWPLGRCILDAIPAPLRPFFIQNYQRCLTEQRPWEHAYECSSAQTYREMHMLVLPLGKAEGLVVINSLTRTAPHQRTAMLAHVELYREASGTMTQCCHCRRMRRVDAHEVWEWVPEWVEQQPETTSHGICEPCFEFHYHPERLSSGIRFPIRTGI